MTGKQIGTNGIDRTAGKWRRKGTPLLGAGFIFLALVFGARVYHYAGVADVEPGVVKTRPSQFRVEGITLIKTVTDGEVEIQARVAQPGQDLSSSFKGGGPAGFVSLAQARATLRRQGTEVWTASGALARLTNEDLEFPKSAVMQPVRGEAMAYKRLRISLDTGRPAGEKQ